MESDKEAKGKSKEVSSGQNSDKLFAGVAIFISLLSLFAVIYQSYLGREANRLNQIQQSASVLPYLSTWSTQTEGIFKFVLGNKGVGPAFITEVSLEVLDPKSNESQAFTNSDLLFDFIIKNSSFLDSLNITTSTLRANSLLSPGETKEVIVIQYGNAPFGSLIRKELGKIKKFKIAYRDVYGAEWYIDQESDGPVKVKDER